MTIAGSGGTLVVQLADLGDLILAGPALHYLRTEAPGRRITILTKASNLGVAGRLADEVIVADKHLFDEPLSILRPRALLELVNLVIDLRRRRFEEIILLHHFVTRWGTIKLAVLSLITGADRRRGLDDGRGWFLTARARDRGFGATTEAEYWQELLGGARPYSMEAQSREARALLKEAGVSGEFAVLHPGSGGYSLARRWPLDHYRALTRHLVIQMGLSVIVVGGEDERSLGNELTADAHGRVINLCGKTGIGELAYILSAARIFVGNDGGVSQLAGLMNAPSVVIFGPTSPATWGPHGTNTRTIRLDLPCSPCFYHHHSLGTPAGCSTRECLIGLAPELVVAAVDDMLARERHAA